MIYQSREDFISNIEPKKTLMGIDFGLRKIGISLCDSSLSFVMPYKILQRRDARRDIPYIREEIIINNVGGVIFGWPMFGDKESVMCKQILKFIENLHCSIGKLPVFLQNEYYTTKRANQVLYSLKFKRKFRDKFDDKIAATFILADFLEGKE